MGFLPKKLLLKAYLTLSDLTDDHRQGQTQKVSAIRYLFALDMFHKKYSENCNLNISENKTTFTSFVKQIVGLESNLYVVDFYKNIKQLDDCGVGSNFYSAGVVKNSIENTSNLYDYPTRGSFPLFNVKDNVLIRNLDYILNVRQYLTTEKFRAAFAIWLLREESLQKLDIDSITNKLRLIYSKELVEAFMPKPENLGIFIDGFELNQEISIPNKDEILSLFSDGIKTKISYYPLQQIYFGAPGTGKSHSIDEIVDDNNSMRTTFHPDSDYSTFVGCYKPQKKEPRTSTPISVAELIEQGKYITELPAGNKVKLQIEFICKYADSIASAITELGVTNGQFFKNNLGWSNDTYHSEYLNSVLSDRVQESDQITYEFCPQAFTTAYVNAWSNPDEPYFLVIEEINRGNCAQVFGDIFQLLDRDETGLSSYRITPDNDLRNYLRKAFEDIDIADEQIKSGEKMQLPGNLHIWATMNTSDQSLFPIDSAFKRRWEWKYIPIDYTDRGHYIQCGGSQYSWASFLEKVNEQIEAVTYSEDKKLGYWFAKPSENGEITADKFVSKVVFYLWNDVFKDFVHDGNCIFKEEYGKFHKFFDYKGDVKPDVVDKFLKSLGVEFVSVDDYIEDDAENGRDTSRYSINGSGNYTKRLVPEEALKIYVSKFSELNAEAVIANWNNLDLKTPNLILSEEEYNTKLANSKDSRFVKRFAKVSWNGNSVYITNQMNVERIDAFMSAVNAKDWGVSIKKID